MSETPGTYGPLPNDFQKPITLTKLLAMHDAGEKIAMLTCYDASFAALCARAGVDVLLVGDSLGMVIQGDSSTLPVTIEQMRYHVACVARGIANAGAASFVPFVIGDLPFATYHASPAFAFEQAATLMPAGAQIDEDGSPRDCAGAVRAYVDAVRRGAFPSAEHTFDR